MMIIRYSIVFVVLSCTKTFGQIASSKYNRVDSQGMCQGFWQYTTGDPHRLDIMEGIYYNNKKVGVWNRKTQEGLIIYQYIYHDTSMHKVQYNEYYHNQSLKSSGFKFPVAHKDTIYAYDEKTDSIDKPIYIDSILMKQGKWTYYYESGEIESHGEYKDDKKKGLWKYYGENGNLLTTKEY